MRGAIGIRVVMDIDFTQAPGASSPPVVRPVWARRMAETHEFREEGAAPVAAWL